MDSILADLWYGHFMPCETCGVGDIEVEQLAKCMSEHEDVLRRMLMGQQMELFERYVRWSDMYACTISEKAFAEGFRIAIRIMTEVMSQ